MTEALLRRNTESLTQSGWKLDELSRCFRKADALLDYIGRIHPGDYVQKGAHKELSAQRIQGIRYCLEKGMPSKEMRTLSLKTVSQLLLMGGEILIKAAWLFKEYPDLFKAKYALPFQTLEKDLPPHLVKNYLVPEYSFPPFKTGENPAISRGDAFLNRCIQMCHDPIFESPEYQKYTNQQKRSEDPYAQWRWKYKAGRRFADESNALQHVIEYLCSTNEMPVRPEKSANRKPFLRKKPRTI